MKKLATFIRSHETWMNFWMRRDRRTPWLYLLFFALFLMTCKAWHIDPQASWPALLVLVVSVLALLRM